MGNVRGVGLMQVLEIVSNSESKMPMSKTLMNSIFETTYQEGVMVRVSGNNIIMSPPLVIDSDHVAKIISALDRGLQAI